MDHDDRDVRNNGYDGHDGHDGSDGHDARRPDPAQRPDGDLDRVREARADAARDDPDVYLDVPTLKVDEVDLEVEDLRARVSLTAEVLDLLKLNVGVDVVLGKVKLDITDVEAQALLKVRLDHVAEIVGDVLRTIEHNPQIVEQVTRPLESTAQALEGGAGEAVGELARGTGEAAKGVGETARGATEAAGSAAGGAAKDVGAAADDAAKDVGGAVGSATGGSPSRGRPRKRRGSSSRRTAAARRHTARAGKGDRSGG